jgi:hypothetical protein
VQVPFCTKRYTFGQDALNGAAVEICEGFRGQAKFFQPLEVEEALLHLLHHTVCVGGPFQVVSDVHAKELEAFHPLWSMDMDGGLLTLLSPEVHDRLLLFVDIEGEVSWHHSAKDLISSL